jgi:hypothetical protein
VLGNHADESWLEWGRAFLGDLARRVDEEKARLEQERLDEERRVEELRVAEARLAEETRRIREEREAEEERQLLEDAAAEEALRLLMEGGDVDFLEDEGPAPVTRGVDTTTGQTRQAGDDDDDVEIVGTKASRPRPRPRRKANNGGAKAPVVGVMKPVASPQEKVSLSSSFSLSELIKSPV